MFSDCKQKTYHSSLKNSHRSISDHYVIYNSKWEQEQVHLLIATNGYPPWRENICSINCLTRQWSIDSRGRLFIYKINKLYGIGKKKPNTCISIKQVNSFVSQSENLTQSTSICPLCICLPLETSKKLSPR